MALNAMANTMSLKPTWPNDVSENPDLTYINPVQVNTSPRAANLSTYIAQWWL